MPDFMPVMKKLNFQQSLQNFSNMLICCSRNISYYQCWKQLCCL